MRSVLQLIPRLGTGVAEQMLVHVTLALKNTEFRPHVATLFDATGTELERLLARAHVPMTSLGKQPGFDLRMFDRVDALIEEVEPVFVHSHGAVLKYALPALLRRRLRGVHTVQNLAEFEADLPGWIVRSVDFRSLVATVAICDEVAASMKRRYRLAPAAVIGNGIPVADYAPASRSVRQEWRSREGVAADLVLFVASARLLPQMNIARLIAAFALLPCDPPSILLIAGEGPQRRRLTGLIADHGAGERVRLLGPRNDVRDMYAAADVFVSASRWEDHRMAVMEAMAAGLPVIATSVGGAPELVEQSVSGILVEPDDETALAIAMRELQESPALRGQLGKMAARRAQHEFDVSRTVQLYVDLYREQLSSTECGLTRGAAS